MAKPVVKPVVKAAPRRAPAAAPKAAPARPAPVPAVAVKRPTVQLAVKAPPPAFSPKKTGLTQTKLSAKSSSLSSQRVAQPTFGTMATMPLKLKKKKKKAIRPDEPPVRLPPPPVTSDSKMQKSRAGLTSRELEHYRDLLLAKRRELLGDVTSMEREALRSGNTNLSTLPVHMADTGTDNYEQEFTLGLVEKDRQLLREINVALAKVQDGSYGLCEGTGKPISKPRLEAQPWARFSIEHARALEKRMFRRAF